jgi:hypothetical protein
MKVLHILLLTAGLIASGIMLSGVSAQNSAQANVSTNSNLSKNSNCAQSAGNSRVAPVMNTNTGIMECPKPRVVSDYPEINYGDEPKMLKVISIEKNVTFKQNGRVQAQIIEEVGRPFTIRFIRDDETIAQFVMRHSGSGYIREYFHSPIDPKASLRLIEIEGAPSPLVHLVMVQPGGSDYGFWSALFGEINGKIQLLTPQTTSFSWEGGIQIGNLGPGNGAGLAVWNSIWDDGESHYGEHVYVVDIYNFNKKLGRFVKTKQLRTKMKHETPTKALESLGLSFYRDAVRDFPEFLEYRENF